ncbi:TPA: sulfur carrier protein ThiS [Candidatus Woesearchaeota archaeon]|nr:sulfur carrier protein ThiS [Candidatus Woesearchaeota archaeon]HII69120.1 sulfur carrier protein ThiS [Candidatus Woesearchaeota archaeon]
MRIRLNGREKETKAATVLDLLKEHALAPDRVVVEKNKAIVPRTTFGDAQLRNGDSIEIVGMIGGG